MNQRITILYLITGFGIGGAEKALLELVKRVNKKKYRVLVASVGPGGPLEEDFKKYSEHCFHFKPRLGFDLGLVTKLMAVLRKYKVEILQTTLFYADVIGVLAARLVKLPVIISWQTALALPTGSVEDDRFRHTWAYRLASSFMHHIVAVSDQVRKYFIQNRHIPKHKISTIHYGVDLEHFNKNNKSIRKEIGLNENDIVLAMVGHLSEVKGHKYLVEVLPSLISTYPNLHLIIAGDGPKRQILQKQIDNLGIQSHVHFLGVRSDIADLMCSGDVFVLPSLYEGLPNVVLEAMASSVPIVASDVGGVSELVINEKTGFLFEAKNTAQLKESLEKLLTSKKRRKTMGRNCRTRIENYFSIDFEIERFEDLYSRLYSKSL